MSADLAPPLPPIELLNSMPSDQLTPALRPLFELVPPLAQALAGARPFSSYAELIDRAAQLLEQMPEAQLVQVLDAHPRIGASPDTLRRTSSFASREQGYIEDAAPDDDADTHRQLADLNGEYERRFGFRFILFLNRRPRAAAIPILQQRLQNPRPTELHTAIQELIVIARDRLNALGQE
jgi:2-oxo-4-hydroxy-4-carboxy--5-ureidoimidazoline (OHCU) decarboxylase